MAIEDLRAQVAAIEGGMPPFVEIEGLSLGLTSSDSDDPFSFIRALIDEADPVFMEAVRTGQVVVEESDLDHGNVETLVDEARALFYREHYGEPVNYGLAWSRLNVIKTLGWAVGVASELERKMNGGEAVEGFGVSW